MDALGAVRYADMDPWFGIEQEYTLMRPVREVDALPIHNQFVISGNVFSIFSTWPGPFLNLILRVHHRKKMYQQFWGFWQSSSDLEYLHSVFEVMIC